MHEPVDVEDLRLRFRGALLRANGADMIEVPANYIREALAVLPPRSLEATEAAGKLPTFAYMRDLSKRLRDWVPGSAFSKKLVNEGADAIQFAMELLYGRP